MDTSERNLEDRIVQALCANAPSADRTDVRQLKPAPSEYQGHALNIAWAQVVPGGYKQRVDKDHEYDKESCLIADDVMDFICSTQPDTWKSFKQQYQGDNLEARKRFLERLSSEISKRSTLDVLRNGIKANGCKFDLIYFRPANHLNPQHRRLYEGNIFTVIRQLRYSTKNDNSLDLTLFLNGLPLFTSELKNEFKSQNVEQAIQQYKETRDVKEPLFAPGRCLAHFAVDNRYVYMTTRLEGKNTDFRPFNQGDQGGSGNPANMSGFDTAYLWERIWARDTVLDLVQNFIQEVEDDNAPKSKKKTLLFPRYHQLETVRSLVTDAYTKGVGQHYLIQHSAGSGKSNTIAWTAYRLSYLHDASNQPVFDSVIVISDRRNLDQQLQRTIRQFEQQTGVVENIDKNAKQLKTALNEGKKIIVTTLQKFPVIANDISLMSGKRFAVIIDEAHSSQTGETSSIMKKALTALSLEEAEAAEGGEQEDLEDKIVKYIYTRGRIKNASFFAFTATPKPKTLELFGQKRDDGKFEAFSLYTMRQAIEEHYILDVLENYTTYKAYWNLLKKIEDDPHYDRRKAGSLLKAFVERHPQTIARKTEIMMEHFHTQVAGRIDNKAKAMIVTASRLHAVRYYQAVCQYLKDKGYPYKVLVAFSGSVEDDGATYDESRMNNNIAESKIAETFKKDEYRILIVANKFQMGFDQPLLHTMYVDKKLGGVNAVQTLSRLNRIAPHKEETMVLDFANEAEHIQEAFRDYYEKTLLSEQTDPNLLYDLQRELSEFELYTDDEIESFARVFYNEKDGQDRLYAVLKPIRERYAEITEQEQADFRKRLNDYIRLYAFLSQVIPFAATELDKLYHFARHLLVILPTSRERLPIEVQRSIDLQSYRLQQTSSNKLILERGTKEVQPIMTKDRSFLMEEDLEPLSQIILDLNTQFGTNFSEEDQVCIRAIEERLAANTTVEQGVRVNSPANARLAFDSEVEKILQQLAETHFKFYKQVIEDNEFAEKFYTSLFERYLKRDQLA